MSAKADEMSRVNGLEYGADDYIAKPFSHTELLARIRAVLRRAHMPALWKDKGVVKVGRASIDMASGRAHVDGAETEFSATEWKLLSYFVRNRRKGHIAPGARPQRLGVELCRELHNQDVRPSASKEARGRRPVAAGHPQFPGARVQPGGEPLKATGAGGKGRRGDHPPGVPQELQRMPYRPAELHFLSRGKDTP